MANLLEQGAARSDIPDYIDDEEEEQPVEAELPDWLKEQIGTPPAAVSGSNAPALDDRVVEPPAPPMPDWLTEDIDAEATLDFDSIFETETPVVSPVASVETPAPHISTEEIQIDAADDPWVEAFELERTMGLDDISQIPDWYAARLEQVSPALSPAELPDEEELSEGELQTLPDWLSDAMTPAAAAAEVEAAVATPVSDMPDWLRASVATPQETEAVELPDWLSVAGVNMEEVPDWLKDTIKTDEAPMVPPEEVPTPTPQVVAAPKSPAIIPAAAAAIDVTATLTNARAEVKSRNLDNALQHYEAVVRANVALDSVVTDLTGLINDEFHKKNPAIYRVLGDGLMRQGKLQEALDTYRKALNLL
jgi:hypothetical protein